eukprot:jgi/Mesen1/9137/ME000058S08628
MRTTRAAAKRAAMDDKPGGTHQAGRRNKRPALANLSNQGNIQSNATAASTKPQDAVGKGKAKVAAHAPVEKAKACLSDDANSSRAKYSVESQESLEGELRSGVEAQTVLQEDPQCSGQKDVGQVRSAEMASLQRRTERHLNISSEPVLAPRDDSVDCSEPERKGWSCSLGYIDIDTAHGDPQQCALYANDIYQHLRTTELLRRPSKDFMETKQNDINPTMRGILVDWLVEVAEEYKLVPDTLYLTCSYIDRFLSSNEVTRSRLQLLGVSCMLIAAKYEEIYAPQVEEFCYITDNTYERTEVIQMERTVLNDLNFELSTPTTKSFLRRYIRAAQAGYMQQNLQLEFLANFLAELTLLEYSFVRFLPSVMAASAIFLAKLTLDPKAHPWTPTLQHYTGYKPTDLQECVLALHALQLNAKGCTLPATREKYRQPKFKGVSALSSPSEIAREFFEDYLDEPSLYV